MAICKFNVDNFAYNIESNLDAMGLPLPKTIWGSVTTISGALTAIDTALTSKASDVPLSAISKSALRSKQLMGIGSAYYAGAIIGSALMAANRASSCSTDELKQAFKDLGLPSWAADEAVSAQKSSELLRKN
ncbi:hypothetical protein [Vibrio parahaemolyticus]|uniref:hypothetical protein n=1 Tax=Vibrio parahaemolyticus TaxID=670 RepID=UPI003004DA3C